MVCEKCKECHFLDHVVETHDYTDYDTDFD